MYYSRFISILLKKKMKQHIGDKEREPLNVNKKKTKKLFENWKKNQVEINKSKQSEESERTISEVHKPKLKEKKRKLADVQEKESKGSAAQEMSENLISTVEKPKVKKIKTIPTGIKTKQHGLMKKKIERKKKRRRKNS